MPRLSPPLLILIALPAVAAPPPCPQPAETLVHDSGERLRYCVEGELALLGDLVLGNALRIRQQGLATLRVTPWQRREDQQQRARPRRQIPLGPGSTTWPLNVVVYQFGKVTPGARQAVLSAMQDIESKTQVRFRERQSERDYVEIVSMPYNGRICGTSYLGRIGGVQRLQIAERCETTVTASHELQHALGFDDRQIRDAAALSERDIRQIDQLYPAINLYSGQEPAIRLSALNLKIDQFGVGHLRGYLQPGAIWQRWQWQDSNGQPLRLKTLLHRSGDRYDLTILPEAFHGKAILSLWVVARDGRVEPRQVTLQVQQAPRADSLAASAASRPTRSLDARIDPMSEAGRQLVLRHSHNQCLATTPPRHRLGTSACDGNAPEQRWIMHADGRLESGSRRQHCLVGTPAARGGMLLLRPCQADSPPQHWRWHEGVLSSQASADERLTAGDGAAPQLYPARADEAITQHWDWR